MLLTIRYQDGSVVQKPLRGGWNYVKNSFGVHILDNGDGTHAARFSNGAVGLGLPGGFYFSQISITLDAETQPHTLPRIAHFAAWGDGPEQVGFGTGSDYFPPGAVKILRWTQAAPEAALYLKRPKTRRDPLLALPVSLQWLRVQYNERAARLTAGLLTGHLGDGLLNQCGVWMPLGEQVGNAQGGEGINPYPGWEFSSRYHLLSHDLTMERMPIDYRDAVTGVALRKANQPEYRSTRGWSKVAQHAEFVVRDENSTDPDARKPVDVNSGSCWYRNTLLAYQAHDDQHLVRALAFAKPAAILWGDKCAVIDLEMMAADAWMGRDPKPVGTVPRAGSAYGRGAAWTLAALNASDATGGVWDNEIRTMIRTANFAQMPCGAWFRAESKDEESLGFAPSPWRDLGMPQQYGVVQTMETCFLGSALYDAMEMAGANIAWGGINRSEPRIGKWMAVADNATMFDNYANPVGVNETFWTWTLAAIAATQEDMERLVPPGGDSPCGVNVLGALLSAGNYGASAKAIEMLGG